QPAGGDDDQARTPAPPGAGDNRLLPGLRPAVTHDTPHPDRPRPPGLSPAAGVLLALLERGPRTWGELAAAGLSAAAVHDAAAELVARGVRLPLGTEAVSLMGPGAAPAGEEP